MKLLFATHNRGKLRELAQLLGDLPHLDVICLADLSDALEIEESGATFADNARIKALAAMQATGLPALADDSGLEVDALGGAPGVHSARYAGPGATDAQRNIKLLTELAASGTSDRRARFRCAIAFVDPVAPDQIELAEGCCGGTITDEPRGDGGFGYDPLFFVETLDKTFAEASAAEKNRLSHRGQAMRQMAAILRRRLVLE